MGYLAKDFDLPEFGEEFKAPKLYGKLSHMEIDMPSNYCRIDLNWYSSKAASKENKKVLATWSFIFPPELMGQFLKEANNQSALAAAYVAIRQMDERFSTIEDDV